MVDMLCWEVSLLVKYLGYKREALTLIQAPTLKVRCGYLCKRLLYNTLAQIDRQAGMHARMHVHPPPQPHSSESGFGTVYLLRKCW